eukprot:6024676-Alexandrium_andersonii.AAC.1
MRAVDPVGEDLHRGGGAEATRPNLPAEIEVLRLIEGLLHEPRRLWRLHAERLHEEAVRPGRPKTANGTGV